MADSTNKQVSVAQAAYDAASVEEFSAWLDANPAMVTRKDKDGKVVRGADGEPVRDAVRRTPSFSANTDEAPLWEAMHSPALRDQSTVYKDGDLSYITRLAVDLLNGVQAGRIKIAKADMDGLIQQAVEDRKAAEAARSDRMRGAASTNQEAYKKAKQDSDLLAKLVAQGLVSREQLAALGQS